MKLDQQAVVSREAFRATLEFDNGDAAAIDGIGVELRLTDTRGMDALGLFGIAPPVVTGMSDVNGGGALPAGAKATAQWTISPTVDAAPLSPTSTVLVAVAGAGVGATGGCAATAADPATPGVLMAGACVAAGFGGGGAK